jgi:hypothetical protein
MRQELIERAVKAHFHPFVYSAPVDLTEQERSHVMDLIAADKEKMAEIERSLLKGVMYRRAVFDWARGHETRAD